MHVFTKSLGMLTRMTLKCRLFSQTLIKKDIVYRQRFHFWEVQALFKSLLTEDEAAEFATILRARGNHEKLEPATLVRYQLGIG